MEVLDRDYMIQSNNLMKIVNILFGKFYSFKVWFSYREKIANWFQVWLKANSLVGKLSFKFFGMRIVKFVKIVRSDGLRINLPIDKIDEGPSWAFIGDEYLMNLGKYFNDFCLKDCDIVIDAGAHVGTFSLACVCVNRNIKIYAIEPSESNVKILKKNVVDNNISFNQFHILKLGLLDKNCEIDFNSGHSSTTGSVDLVGVYKEKGSQKLSFSRKSSSVIKIECISLSNLFSDKKIASCRLLKLDCEGSEYRILQGMDIMYWNMIDYMVIEAHPSQDGSPLELKTLIESRNFDVFTESLGNGCYEFYCKNIRLSRI